MSMIAENIGHLVVDDLHDHLSRGDALDDLLAYGALAHVVDELLGHLEVHVGLEQDEADLAHRLVDVLLAKLAPTAQPGEDLLHAIAKALEHFRFSLNQPGFEHHHANDSAWAAQPPRDDSTGKKEDPA
jgi:hypothetical protein